jgi:hypothetical protein
MQRSKKGSQIALFTDEHVRRDYLKSKQWIQQHMRIKLHMSGMAVAYENITGARPKNPDRPKLTGRYQGSLFNQQKHAIADAVEWIRQNSKYKPRIFVATSPGFMDHPAEGRFIQKLVHNLKNGYGMTNFVWVRELTQNGYPHYHFVADVKRFDAVRLSLSWSRLFGSEAKNSIRLGTKPGKNGRRKFWIDSKRMCWYLTKYIGKSIGDAEKGALKGQRRKFRTFGISQEARKMSQPLLYDSYAVQNYNGRYSRQFVLNDDQLEPGLPTHINPHAFNWKWTGHGQTYIGFQVEKRQPAITKTLKITEISQKTTERPVFRPARADLGEPGTFGR